MFILPPLFIQGSFAEFYDFSSSGQIGDTIGGITAPIIGSITIILIYMAYRTQREELSKTKEELSLLRFEGLFYDSLKQFADEKGEIAIKLQEYQHSEMFIKVQKHTEVTEQNRELKLNCYFFKVAKEFTSKYSIRRLSAIYYKYLKSFEFFVDLIMNCPGDHEYKNRTRSSFLLKFTDAELKMLTYYYYLIHDNILFEKDEKPFKRPNIIKQSKILEDDYTLMYTDAFLNNIDPRNENNFRIQIEKYRNDVDNGENELTWVNEEDCKKISGPPLKDLD